MHVIVARRLLSFLLILAPATAAAQDPRFTWDDPTPHGQLTLTELTRDDSGATVAVTYLVEARGLPADKRFQVWVRRAPDVDIGPIAVTGPDDSGTVRAHRVGAVGVAPGEVVHVALVSEDLTVRLFANATPLSIDREIPADIDEPAIDVSFDFGTSRWQPADQEVNGAFMVTRWARDPESADVAPEIVSSTVVRHTRDITPRHLAAGVRAAIERQCEGAAWHVFVDTPDELAYAWTARRCADGPRRVEIARVIDVDGHLVRTAYTAEASELTPALAAEWLERFAAAKLWRRPITR